jgi:hypothetical protein
VNHREIDIEVREKIDLCQQHQIGVLEHHRVLDRLVLALGDRQRDHVGRLTEIVDRRAHEVADVLDEEHVELAPRHVM